MGLTVLVTECDTVDIIAGHLLHSQHLIWDRITGSPMVSLSRSERTGLSPSIDTPLRQRIEKSALSPHLSSMPYYAHRDW